MSDPVGVLRDLNSQLSFAAVHRAKMCIIKREWRCSQVILTEVFKQYKYLRQ